MILKFFGDIYNCNWLLWNFGLIMCLMFIFLYDFGVRFINEIGLFLIDLFKY